MNKILFAGLVISLNAMVLSVITVQTVNAILLSPYSNSNQGPDSQNHWNSLGQCVSPAKMGELVLGAEQCAIAGPDCPNGQQTLVISQDDDDGPIFNQDPCLTIVLISDDDEKDDDEKDDEGVQNKLDNINESTNDEDAPINQPDNVGSNNNLQSQSLALQPAQQGRADPSGQGLVDLCVQQGLSVNTCNNYLLSENPGGACQSAAAGGGGCGVVQDPAKTFNNPGLAQAESNRKIQQLENGLQGFAQTQMQTEQQKKTIENSLRLNPPGDLGSIFAGPGSTTNRPGQ
jgi:hypothetical protein